MLMDVNLKKEMIKNNSESGSIFFRNILDPSMRNIPKGSGTNFKSVRDQFGTLAMKG